MATLNVQLAVPAGARATSETEQAIRSVFHQLLHDVFDELDRDFAPVADAVGPLLASGADDACAGVHGLLHGVATRNTLRAIDRLRQTPELQELVPPEAFAPVGARPLATDIGRIGVGPTDLPPLIVWIDEGGSDEGGGEDGGESQDGVGPLAPPEWTGPKAPTAPSKPEKSGSKNVKVKFQIARKVDGKWKLDIKIAIPLPGDWFEWSTLAGFVSAMAGAVVSTLSAAALGFPALGALLFGLLWGFVLGALAVGLVYLVVQVGKEVGDWLGALFRKLFYSDKDKDDDMEDGKPNGLIWLPTWSDWIPDQQDIIPAQPPLFAVAGLTPISPTRYGQSWRPGVP